MYGIHLYLLVLDVRGSHASWPTKEMALPLEQWLLT